MYDINTYQNRDVKEKSRDNLPGDDKKRILHRTAPPSTVLRNTEHKITAGHGYPNSQYAFFSGIKENVVQNIHSRMVHQKYEKKDYIYFPYDQVEKIYFIKQGNVEIGYLDESGRELSLDILGVGDVFGSILNENFSGGFARAIDKTIVAILNKTDFDEFMEKYPRFSGKILRSMSDRISTLEMKLQNLVFSDVRTRICKLLLSLYEKAGDQRSGQIKISLTHQDIANLVASSRETASLHLSNLKKDGTIAYERKRIRILSLRNLQRCYV